MNMKSAAEKMYYRKFASNFGGTVRSILFGLVNLLPLSLVAESPTPAAPLTGEKAITHLKAAGQYESLAAAITGARYAVMPMEDRAENPKSSAFSAQNPAHGLNSTFSPEGLTFTPRAGAGNDTYLFNAEISPRLHPLNEPTRRALTDGRGAGDWHADTCRFSLAAPVRGGCAN